MFPAPGGRDHPVVHLGARGSPQYLVRLYKASEGDRHRTEAQRIGAQDAQHPEGRMKRAFAILAAGWIACTSALAASSDRSADESAREQFYRIRQWAASRGLNIHRHNDKSVGLVLDIFERVNREHP